MKGPHQPRTTLTPLIATMSVAAWERLVADIAALSRCASSDEFEPGMSDSKGHSRLGLRKDGSRSTAIDVLSKASNGELPLDGVCD